MAKDTKSKLVQSELPVDKPKANKKTKSKISKTNNSTTGNPATKPFLESNKKTNSKTKAISKAKTDKKINKTNKKTKSKIENKTDEKINSTNKKTKPKIENKTDEKINKTISKTKSKIENKTDEKINKTISKSKSKNQAKTVGKTKKTNKKTKSKTDKKIDGEINKTNSKSKPNPIIGNIIEANDNTLSKELLEKSRKESKKNTVRTDTTGKVVTEPNSKNAGRKSKYHTHVIHRLHEVKKWREDGATEEYIADELGINISTLNVYRAKYKAFKEVLIDAKKLLIKKLEDSLFKRAMGYEIDCKTVEMVEEDLVSGTKKGRKKISTTTKHFAPDTNSLIFALCNMDAENWKQRRTETVEGEIPLTVNFKNEDKLED